jgi:deoxyribonuclease-4
MQYIGVHLSISGGAYRALEKAKKLNIRAVQIFLKNSTRWNAKPYTDDDIQKFRTAQSHIADIRIFAHTGYLINLAGVEETYRRSMDAMMDEANRSSLLGIKNLVLHPGSHGGRGVRHGIDSIAESLSLVLNTHKHVTILLETTAGQGSSLGWRFEQIRSIIDKTTHPDMLGVCLDTCHVFAAGYDISTEKNFNSTVREFDDILGIGNLKLIHLNDSKGECGGKIDRHEHIGKGRIGVRGFSLLLNDQRLEHIPKILETPKFNNDEADKMNLETVHNLLKRRNDGN